MGMYDSFYMTVTCPRCGKTGVIELQTKQFECSLRQWKENEPFITDCIEITDGVIKDVYGGCNSEHCRKLEKEERGYNSGFGMHILADIRIKDGLVCKAINIRE